MTSQEPNEAQPSLWCRLLGHDWEVIPLDETSDGTIHYDELAGTPIYRCGRCGEFDDPPAEQMQAASEPGIQPERTLASVMVGAWTEAVNETGFRRVSLVLLMAFMTIPFAPAWILLALLEYAGVWGVEEGLFP